MIQLNEWRITGFVAIILLLLVGAAFSFTSVTDDAVHIIIRGTAGCSVLLFCMAITASSLYSLVKADWTAWLLRNRRYIGVSFALSHTVHFSFLMHLFMANPSKMMGDMTIIIFIVALIGYLFVLAMTITSFPGPRRWLGERGWKLLHTTGVYVIWVIFVKMYVTLSVTNQWYLPFSILLFIAIFLRMARAIKRKGKVQTSISS